MTVSLSSCNLSDKELKILMYIRDKGSVSPLNSIEIDDYSLPSIRRSISKLKKYGYINIIPNLEEMRSIIIKISNDGYKIVNGE